MLIVKMTPKRLPVCPGCKFAVETEDGHVYCGNREFLENRMFTWYLQTTTCKCGRRELPEIGEFHVD